MVFASGAEYNPSEAQDIVILLIRSNRWRNPATNVYIRQEFSIKNMLFFVAVEYQSPEIHIDSNLLPWTNGAKRVPKKKVSTRNINPRSTPTATRVSEPWFVVTRARSR